MVATITYFKNQGEAFINSYNKDKDPAARLENGVNNSWYDQTTGKPTEKYCQETHFPIWKKFGTQKQTLLNKYKNVRFRNYFW